MSLKKIKIKSISYQKCNSKIKIEEPTSVAVKEQIDTMQVEMNKLIVSIKINEILDDPQDKIKKELALNLLFDLYFLKVLRYITNG